MGWVGTLTCRGKAISGNLATHNLSSVVVGWTSSLLAIGFLMNIDVLGYLRWLLEDHASATQTTTLGGEIQ